MHFLLLVPCMMAFAALKAAEFTFEPATSGTFDLADATLWGGNDPDGNANLLVKKGNNLFTASQDITCKGIYFLQSAITNVVELEQGRTIKVLGGGNYEGVKIGTMSTTPGRNFRKRPLKAVVGI